MFDLASLVNATPREIRCSVSCLRHPQARADVVVYECKAQITSFSPRRWEFLVGYRVFRRCLKFDLSSSIIGDEQSYLEGAESSIARLADRIMKTRSKRTKRG